MVMIWSLEFYCGTLGSVGFIFVAFGVDFMTGCGAVLVVGYGFFVGWIFVLFGDFFASSFPLVVVFLLGCCW